MEIGNDNNRITISERCEDIKNKVVNRVDKQGISSIRAEVKDDALANDNREILVFPEESTKGNVVSVEVTSIFSIIFLLLLAFSISIVIFSGDYGIYGLIGILISIAVLIINTVFIYKSISMIQFKKRYSRYYIYFKNRKCALTDDISRLFSIDRKTVINDLKQALLLRYIPHGQLVNEDKLIVFSSDSFAKYSKKKNEIDEKVNLLLSGNSDEDTEYAAIIENINSTLKLIKNVKKKGKNSIIKKELEKMERILTAVKYSNDLVDDDQNSISTFINCYCTSMERVVESFLEIENNKSLSKKEYRIEEREEHREALECVNRAFENVLTDYYEEYSIL